MSKIRYQILKVRPTEQNETYVSFRWKQSGYPDKNDQLILPTEPKSVEELDAAVQGYISEIIEAARASQAFKGRMSQLERNAAGPEREFEI